jgi:hypothetical protein
LKEEVIEGRGGRVRLRLREMGREKRKMEDGMDG